MRVLARGEVRNLRIGARNRAARLDMWGKGRRVPLCLWECPGRTGSGDDQERGGVMAASVGVSSEWSLAGTAPSRADLVIGSRVPAETAAPPSSGSFPHMFEVRCAELHPVRRDVRLRAPSLESLVSMACEHGAFAHGFTPCWYSSPRLASMAEIVAQRCG